MIVTVIFQSTPSAWRETAPSASNKNLTGKFQSTPSAWRETIRLNQDDFTTCISIHSLRMEGDPVSSGKTIRQSISIHSLRMEGDEMSTVSEYVGEAFQSTPSAWRETIMYFVSKMEKLISIHSLRMEGDHIFESVLCEISNFNPLPPHGGRPYGSRVIQCPLNFNPLPPHGGRRKTTCGMSTQAAFQSTPSAWRETALN